MSSDPYVTRRPSNEESFRETLLIQIADREDREALRRVGCLLYTLALEAFRPSRHGDEPVLHAWMRAVSVDLHFLEGYLASIVEDAGEPEDLPADEAALIALAGELAGKVCALAEEIEAKLRSPCSDKERNLMADDSESQPAAEA
ncbi:MAG TPA: hypothetical protein VHG32_25180 [Thermoanaerobaculia bacterium]|nr:hypothetical protein [Thermoanaerobaculia bacterium]